MTIIVQLKIKFKKQQQLSIYNINLVNGSSLKIIQHVIAIYRHQGRFRLSE